MSLTLTKGGGVTPSEGMFTGSGSLGLTKGANTLSVVDIGGGSLELTGNMAYAETLVEVKTTSFNVTAADDGKTFIIGAVDLIANLPATGPYRFHFVIKTPSTTTGFSISPVAADSINGGTDNKDLINSAGTDAVGDSITVNGDSSVGWYTSGKVGTWAAEA